MNIKGKYGIVTDTESKSLIISKNNDDHFLWNLSIN